MILALNKYRPPSNNGGIVLYQDAEISHMKNDKHGALYKVSTTQRRMHSRVAVGMLGRLLLLKFIHFVWFYK